MTNMIATCYHRLLHTSYKFNVGKVHFFKKVCKDPSSLTLIKMLGLNITLTEELFKRQKYLSKL